jgi:hypothetical protein
MVRAHIITIIAVIALSGCASSDERAFNAAAKQNTVESYSEFLHNYPDSIHRGEALALKDDATFSEIKRINSKRGYDAYISHYPTGRHVAEAKALREQIVLQEQQRRCKYAKAAGNAYKGVVAGNSDWAGSDVRKTSLPRFPCSRQTDRSSRLRLWTSAQAARAAPGAVGKHMFSSIFVVPLV